MVETLASAGHAEAPLAFRRPRVVVGIPAFNEERMIARVVLCAQRVADHVVVCDDGSTDLTGEIAGRLGAEVIRHERNMGYGAAVRSLFRRARELDADVLVTLDGDGQHDPAEVPVLAAPALDGRADIVIGSRFLSNAKRSDVPGYRRLGIRVITRLTRAASDSGISDAQSGFRAYGRRALSSLGLAENGMGASVEALVEAKAKGLIVAEVPVSCRYRGLDKTSTFHPLRHGVGVAMSVVRLVVEEQPLLFLGVPGLLALLVGVFFGVWMLRIYAAEHQIVTNIALAAVSFILIGLFAVFTAITLYAISRLTQKMNGKR